MLIKSIYTLFLALLIALFVGFGIDSFYPAPKYPEYPSKPMMIENVENQKEQMILDQKYNEEHEKYQSEIKKYNKNVSIIILSLSIVILVISLTFLSKIKMISDGILMGGIFTTIYSLIRGTMSESSIFRFLIITIGLIIALVLGYIKFIRGQKN